MSGWIQAAMQQNTIYKGPPYDFLADYKIKKHQMGDPYKMS